MGETTDGGQVTCAQGNKRTHVYILHIVANDSRFFYLVCASKIFRASVLVSSASSLPFKALYTELLVIVFSMIKLASRYT